MDTTTFRHRGPKPLQGFSILELLIAIAIIAIVSIIALPAYQAYVDTSKMTRVNAAYQHSVKSAQETYKKDATRLALGMESKAPKKAKDWINLFNENNEYQAPDGGPAYITRGQQKKYGLTSHTGAIRIQARADGSRVDIYRPAYKDLEPYRTRIFRDRVVVKKLNP